MKEALVIAGTGFQINDFPRMELGYLPVLSLRIEQVPEELGVAYQTVSIELLKRDLAGKVVLTFKGVQDLKVSRIHPGTRCALQIDSVVPDQLEDLRYRVFNGEQDFTLHLLCKDIEMYEHAL